MDSNSERDDLRIVVGRAAAEALARQEERIIEVVAASYLAYAGNPETSPNSQFLLMPGDRRRIIALPGRVGDETAGIKWIASFPSNRFLGLERASAVIVLNSVETGRPQWIVEGSGISAMRTAASAVLVVRLLGFSGESAATIIGCGRINYEILRFLTFVMPALTRVSLFDIEPGRAENFARKVACVHPSLELSCCSSIDRALGAARVQCIATSAVEPHIENLGACPPGSLLLHISLRDIAPAALLSAVNIVDDANHVCRARTSAHLAEELTGNRGFIHATLPQLLRPGAAAYQRTNDKPTIFHPFGLGILDVAVGHLCVGIALEKGLIERIPRFFPETWSQGCEPDTA